MRVAAEAWPTPPRTAGSSHIGIGAELALGCLHKPGHAPHSSSGTGGKSWSCFTN